MHGNTQILRISTVAIEQGPCSYSAFSFQNPVHIKCAIEVEWMSEGLVLFCDLVVSVNSRRGDLDVFYKKS